MPIPAPNSWRSGCLFIYCDPKTALDQCKSGGKTTDTPTSDEDVSLVHWLVPQFASPAFPHGIPCQRGRIATDPNSQQHRRTPVDNSNRPTGRHHASSADFHARLNAKEVGPE